MGYNSTKWTYICKKEHFLGACDQDTSAMRSHDSEAHRHCKSWVASSQRELRCGWWEAL